MSLSVARYLRGACEVSRWRVRPVEVDAGMSARVCIYVAALAAVAALVAGCGGASGGSGSGVVHVPFGSSVVAGPYSCVVLRTGVTCSLTGDNPPIFVSVFKRGATLHVIGKLHVYCLNDGQCGRLRKP